MDLRFRVWGLASRKFISFLPTKHQVALGFRCQRVHVLGLGLQQSREGSKIARDSQKGPSRGPHSEFHRDHFEKLPFSPSVFRYFLDLSYSIYSIEEPAGNSGKERKLSVQH